MYPVILTVTATVPRPQKFKKQMCPYERALPYTSVDIDVSTDVDNIYL